MVATTEQMPDIRTALPGPKTKALIERDQRLISSSYTRGYPLAIDRGEGAIVIDPDGNRFLDYCAGIAVCTTGHSHPRIVDAIVEQSKRFIHMSGTDFYYENMVELAEKLVQSTPGGSDKKVFFGNSGTEAIEGSLKLARYHTGRQGIISFYRSFHGRTFGSMAVTASKAVHKKRFLPLMPGVHHAHYPYHYREPRGNTPEETGQACLDFIRDTLFKMVISPDEVAAIIIEPIQGEGGYVAAPGSFLTGLQKLAREHGILIIADEVQSGVGRTGKMWASQHTDGFEPDIIACAKGIASGLPLGAFIAKAHVMDWVPGTHATTFGGNPVACAAALETFKLLEEGLLDNARVQGVYLLEKLRGLQDRFEVIGDVRGWGLMIGMEMVESKETKAKASDLRNKVVDACFYHGLLLLGCGENTIRFSPPLVINREQSDKAIEILADVLTELVSA